MTEKKTRSGAALFMYATMAVAALISAVGFFCYYTGCLKSEVLLWCAIVCFMILYHFGLRILFGLISARLPIDYRHPFFAPRPFERHVFRLLRVRQWKDRVLTFDPDSFDLKRRGLAAVCHTMAKSEVDHWINELISLFSLLFALLWGQFPIFLITALAAMAFDFQFILVQRYNRPIAVRLLQRREAKTPR